MQPSLLELGSAAFSARSTTTSQAWQNLFTASLATNPGRAEEVQVKGDIRAAMFDFDGTLTATPGDRSERKYKIAELKERAPLLRPWLERLRSAGIVLGIISKSSEDTILTALSRAGLRELFDGPIVAKALGFEGKAGFIQDMCLPEGHLQHLGQEGIERVLLVDDDLLELQRAREKSIQTFPAPKDGGLQYDDLQSLFGLLGLEGPPRPVDSKDICRIWSHGLAGRFLGMAQDLTQVEYQEDPRPQFYDYYKIKDGEVQLGEGAFGVCALGVHVSSGKECAIKFMRKEVVGRHFLDTFVEQDFYTFLLDMANEEPHPNVVRHLDCMMGPTIIYCAMELLEGSDLDTYLQENAPITQGFAQRIVRQVSLALEHIHGVRGTGLIHRDVKLANLRFRQKDPNSDLVLMDFNLSCPARPAQKRGIVGTLVYMAPEIFSGQYTTQVDMWSTGVLLYFILMGSPPWKQDQATGVCLNRQVANGSAVMAALEAAELANSPPLAVALLKALLVVDPAERLSATAACQHEWLAEGRDSASPVNVDKNTYMSAHAYTLQTPKAKLSLLLSMNESEASPIAGHASTVLEDSASSSLAKLCTCVQDSDAERQAEPASRFGMQ